MKFFHKIFVALVFIFIIYPSFILPANAEGEISSAQNVTFQVFESGRTHVRHDVSLTNLTTNYYASEYSLFLGFTDLENITATDSLGTLSTEVAPGDDGTNIHMVFNDQVVGKSNVLSFSISYDTEEVASRNGRIWEINIPRIKDSPDLGDYTTRLVVPVSFGKANYIKPTLSVPTGALVFQKEDVLRGISVVFGDYQLFDFSLSYHVKNDKLYPIITEIALPPTTSYQDIILETLDPAPITVYVDRDGNWLARYRLEGSEKLDITAVGRAKIYHTPQKDLLMETGNMDTYLKPQKYWEVADGKITEKAGELKTPKAIYDYVAKTLQYDFDRIEKGLPRAGAAEVMGNPKSAICMEFTDLFIALARSAGIPAREVDGFAYTKNSRLRPLSLEKDILHAWPEYYDSEKKMWIAVDPTWGSTSGIEYFDIFDFNHFAFVVKGQDSEYPSPAGSYKEASDLDKKDVEVSFAKDKSFVEKRALNIETDLSKRISAGFPTTVTLRVSNNGNKMIAGGNLLFSTARLLPESQTIAFSPLPPFGNALLAAAVQSPSYFDNFSTKATAGLGKEVFAQEIHVAPIYLVYLPVLGGGLGAIIILIIALKIWGVHIQRPKWSNPLRGKGKQPPQPSGKLPPKKG